MPKMEQKIRLLRKDRPNSAPMQQTPNEQVTVAISPILFQNEIE